MKVVREDYYFDEPGPKNTDDVVEAVVKRVGETKIRCVIVASHSGETALKFAKALKGRASVVCVSPAPSRRERGREWPSVKAEIRKELESLGVLIVERAPYVMEDSVVEFARWTVLTPDRFVREVLYCLGSGFKVAVQVTFMAVSSGYVDPHQDVIAVGGTGKGADTAIVLKSTHPEFLFAEDPEKRLEVREVVAMPRKKL